MEDKEKSLRELQKEVKELCRKKGWDEISIPENFLLFTEEVGELSKAIRKNLNLLGEGKDKSNNLEEEMGDVLSYLMDLANKLDIDLQKAMVRNLKRNK